MFHSCKLLIRPHDPPPFHNSFNVIRSRVQVLILLNKYFFPMSYYFSPLSYNYSPQNSVLKCIEHPSNLYIQTRDKIRVKISSYYVIFIRFYILEIVITEYKWVLYEITCYESAISATAISAHDNLGSILLRSRDKHNRYLCQQFRYY